MTQKVKVLLAEKNGAAPTALPIMLRNWGYEVIPAKDGAEALAILQNEDGPRMAVLDGDLQGIDGFEICRQVRSDSASHYVYILLLTARTEMRDLVTAMEAGADDYLAAPFDAQELRARLRAGARIVELQERLIKAREELYEQATRDALTGLWNRATILRILEIELARARRGSGTMALLMLDLDHFKQINDTHGHLTGDAVLRDVARRASSILRQYDSIGRYGGEEFLVVVPGCDFVSSLAVADRLRHAIGSRDFSARDVSLPLTCSIGVACTEYGNPENPDELLAEADAALYAAKRNGRNRVEWASNGAHARTRLAEVPAVRSKPAGLSIYGYLRVPD